MFGCPVYVLEPKLQDGKKIPKWSPRARLGMFLGFSPVHSSLVPLVLNVRTGKISPQYHVIFDDKFETVVSLSRGKTLDVGWHQLFKLGREQYLDVEYDSVGNVNTSHLPDLCEDWLDPTMMSSDSPTAPPGIPTGSSPSMPSKIPSVSPSSMPANPPTGSPPAVLAHNPSGSPLASERVHDLPEGVTTVPEGATKRCSRRDVSKTWKDGPAKARVLPTDEELRLADGSASKWGQPAAFVANRGCSASSYHPTRRITKAFLAAIPLLCDSWADVRLPSPATYINHDPWNVSMVQSMEPFALAARASKYNEDSPNWSSATNGPFQEEFWTAMETELKTLEDDMHSWELVPRTSDMHVLSSTWAFKIKRFPDGLIKKFKARFCVRGDQQKEGVDYFETWSPVAQWSTIRTMMVLAAKLNLKSAQCDITAAFLHAKLPAGEDIYVHQP